MSIPVAEYQAPTDSRLRELIVDYLKRCTPGEYRDMKRLGELEDFITRTIATTRRHADGLIASGVFAGEAWNQAIRLIIMHSETD